MLVSPSCAAALGQGGLRWPGRWPVMPLGPLPVTLSWAPELLSPFLLTSLAVLSFPFYFSPSFSISSAVFLDLLPRSPSWDGPKSGVPVQGATSLPYLVFFSCWVGLWWAVTHGHFVFVSLTPTLCCASCAAFRLLTHSSGKAHRSLRPPNTPHPRRSSRSRSSACLMTRLSLRSA